MAATGEEAVKYNQFTRLMDLPQSATTNEAISMKQARKLLFGSHNENLPTGYVQLDYIQSTGNEIIDTEFNPNNNSRVVMDIEILNGNGTFAVFGGRTTMSYANFSLFIVSSVFRSDFGSTNLSTGVSASGRFTIDKNKNQITINDQTFSNTDATFSSTNSLALFTVKGAGSGSGTFDDRYVTAKLYSCAIYNNGTEVRHFVPAKRYSDDTVGLFDTVEQKFYESYTNSSFIAGPETQIVEEVSEFDNCAIKLSQLKRLYIYLNPPIPDFVNPITGSWSELGELSSQITDDNIQYYKDYYTPYIGQKRIIPVTYIYDDVEWELIGVCHDVKTSGQPAMLTWSCLRGVYMSYMNGDSSNGNRPGEAGGWEGCYPRSFLMWTFPNRMPSEVNNVVAEVQKENSPRYGASITYDKYWILSKAEVGLGGSVGTKYSAFNSNTDRLRKPVSGYPGSDWIDYDTWFLRSVFGTYEFDRVNNDGSFLTSAGSSEHMTVPNFCV